MDANKDTQVALAAKLGIVPSVLNSIITRGKTPKNVMQNVTVWSKERPETVSFSRRGKFIGQWFKQTRAECHNCGTLLRGKGLHIATRLGIDFKASNGWISDFKQ